MEFGPARPTMPLATPPDTRSIMTPRLTSSRICRT